MTLFQATAPINVPRSEVALVAGVGWRSVSEGEAVLALVKDGEPGRVDPNILVFVLLHSLDFDPRMILDDLESDDFGLADVSGLPPFEVTLGDLVFTGQVIAFRDPRAGTLAQVHMVARIPATDSSEVVHVVGSCGADQVKVDLPEIRDVIDTLRVSMAS